MKSEPPRNTVHSVIIKQDLRIIKHFSKNRTLILKFLLLVAHILCREKETPRILHAYQLH